MDREVCSYSLHVQSVALVRGGYLKQSYETEHIKPFELAYLQV